QNDPSWRDFIMQAGGDPIGGFGCALTSTTMLLNYYGSSMSPADLNACLGPGADPIVWTQAPLCTAGRVQGGERSDFSWDAVDGLLRAGKPAIVGMLRGLTGMHFVVVTQGGGGEADNYHITDPWDGTVSKTLGSYTNTGYNPRWLVSYDGSGRNCARLLPPSPPLVRGFQDGATYRGGVSVSVPSGAPGATVQPASGQGSSGQPGGPASGTRTQPPSASASTPAPPPWSWTGPAACSSTPATSSAAWPASTTSSTAPPRPPTPTTSASAAHSSCPASARTPSPSAPPISPATWPSRPP